MVSKVKKALHAEAFIALINNEYNFADDYAVWKTVFTFSKQYAIAYSLPPHPKSNTFVLVLILFLFYFTS